MENILEKALMLVMESLSNEVSDARRAFEEIDRNSDHSMNNVMWSAKYHGRRMARLATVAQNLKSLSQGR